MTFCCIFSAPRGVIDVALVSQKKVFDVAELSTAAAFKQVCIQVYRYYPAHWLFGRWFNTVYRYTR